MESLGINFLNIIVYSLFFLLLYILIKIKFVPGIEKALTLRQKEIEKGLKMAQDADSLKAEIEIEKQAILNQAKNQKKEILLSARKQVNEESRQIIAEAKEKAGQIIGEAQNVINLDNEKLQEKINSMVDNKLKDKLEGLASQGKIKVNIDNLI